MNGAVKQPPLTSTEFGLRSHSAGHTGQSGQNLSSSSKNKKLVTGRCRQAGRGHRMTARSGHSVTGGGNGGGRSPSSASSGAMPP